MYTRALDMLLLLALLFALALPSAATTGPQLHAALDSPKRILLPEDVHTFTEVMSCLSQQANVRGEARIKLGSCRLPCDDPRLNIGSTSGTLRELLDKIAENIDYTWDTNGDWINFTPRTTPVEMSVVMRRRMPGEVVVSRDRQAVHGRAEHPWRQPEPLQLQGPEACVDSRAGARQAEALHSVPRSHRAQEPDALGVPERKHDVYGSDFYEVSVKALLQPDGKSVKSVWLDPAGGERFADWPRER